MINDYHLENKYSYARLNALKAAQKVNDIACVIPQKYVKCDILDFFEGIILKVAY